MDQHARVAPGALEHALASAAQVVCVGPISSSDGYDVILQPACAESRLKDRPVGDGALHVVGIGGAIVMQRDEVERAVEG